MCRLYGFHATEPTKVECTLVHAQNALMAQSRSDLESVSHSHGWGVATYPASDGAPQLERQAWAAHHGEHFQRAAARAYAETAIAHVRRATVGVAALENTHPFVHGRWVFAHNGTVPRFDRVRERLLGEIAPAHRALIKGQTDSEHMFRYALTLLEAGEVAGPRDAVARVVKDIVAMTREIAPDDPIGLKQTETFWRERVWAAPWSMSPVTASMIARFVAFRTSTMTPGRNTVRWSSPPNPSPTSNGMRRRRARFGGSIRTNRGWRSQHSNSNGRPACAGPPRPRLSTPRTRSPASRPAVRCEWFHPARRRLSRPA